MRERNPVKVLSGFYRIFYFMCKYRSVKKMYIIEWCLGCGNKKGMMKMPAESRILERAEQYIRKLSIGVNPLNEETLPEGDSCRQERISKCLAYVADYLQQKIGPKREPQAPKKNSKREARAPRKFATAELAFTPEVLGRYEVTEEPVSVSGVVRRLNSLIPEDSGMIPLIYSDVAEILTREGMLLKEAGEKGKDMNLPSPRGEEMGFVRAEADIRGHHAVYTKCNAAAQRFILENIQACIAQANERFAKYQAQDQAREAAGETAGNVAPKDGKVVKERFHLTEAELAKYPADETPVPVTEIARRLNDLLAPGANIEKLYFKSVRDWFVAQGLLESKTDAVGKTHFDPTEAGLAAGILTEQRIGKNGESYNAVLYGPAAQKLVLEHVNELGQS